MAILLNLVKKKINICTSLNNACYCFCVAEWEHSGCSLKPETFILCSGIWNIYRIDANRDTN